MKYSSPTFDDFLSRLQLLRPQASHATLNQRQAAVPAPVVRRPQPGLLLTQRPVHLRKHAGQVVSLGGAVDSSNTSLIATTPREAQEEVVIPPPRVEVIGVLPLAGSATGFQVISVVGIIPPNLLHRISGDEASTAFEIPSAQALHLSRYHPLDIYRHGNSYRVWLSRYEQCFVWGMTVGVTRELALQIGIRLRLCLSLRAPQTT